MFYQCHFIWLDLQNKERYFSHAINKFRFFYSLFGKAASELMPIEDGITYLFVLRSHCYGLVVLILIIYSLHQLFEVKKLKVKLNRTPEPLIYSWLINTSLVTALKGCMLGSYCKLTSITLLLFSWASTAVFAKGPSF